MPDDDDRNRGREFGRRLVAAIRNYVGRAHAELAGRLDALAKDVQKTPTLEVVRGEIDLALRDVQSQAAQPALTVEDFRPFLEAELARWQLDFERRAHATMERVIDRLPVPKDGKDGEDGKDGKDGGSVEDFDITLNERELTVSMQIGGRIVSRVVRVDVPLERGVWQAKSYQKSDIVTFGGSQFIATRDTLKTEKPEASAAWRLVVKRGRDGKDAEGGQ